MWPRGRPPYLGCLELADLSVQQFSTFMGRDGTHLWSKGWALHFPPGFSGGVSVFTGCAMEHMGSSELRETCGLDFH